MKNYKISFDLSDHPQVVDMLRLVAAKEGLSQKAVLLEALKGYFANKVENMMVSRVAEKAFAEWDNAEDAIYDSL